MGGKAAPVSAASAGNPLNSDPGRRGKELIRKDESPLSWPVSGFPSVRYRLTPLRGRVTRLCSLSGTCESRYPAIVHGSGVYTAGYAPVDQQYYVDRSLNCIPPVRGRKSTDALTEPPGSDGHKGALPFLI